MNNITPLILASDSPGDDGRQIESDCDCDCACPETSFKPTLNELAAGTLFAPPTGSFSIPLSAEFSAVHSPVSTSGVVVLNTESLRYYHQFADRAAPLLSDVDLSLAEHHLLTPVGSVPSFSEGRHTLTAWLHVTNACNLDCPYCYVRKSSARMTEATGELALERLAAEAVKGGFKQLKVKYAGGEASLHYKLVIRLHEIAKSLAERHHIELREVLLSNGVSIPSELADWLVTAGVKLMLSLDGLGTEHDQQRPFKNGQASFKFIERTIDEVLLPRGLRPDISVTITRLNAGGVADLMEWILARNLSFSLNFYRQNLQSQSRAELLIEEQAIINGLRSAYRVIEKNLPTRPFFNGLLDRVQGRVHTHTCSVGNGYVVVSHEGKLAQCQMHLSQTIGDIETSKPILPILSAGPIQNLSVEQKEGCRDCNFRYLCTGGCPLETYRATGRWDVQSPNCGIYKALLPEAIRLEGLRILKVQGVC